MVICKIWCPICSAQYILEGVKNFKSQTMKIVKSILLASILILSSNITSAQLEWVEFNGELPSKAVIGGVETHRSLAVCRCEYKGAMHPGKVVDGKCNIGWGGKEIRSESFEVLVNKGVVEIDWLKTNGKLPDHAIEAGDEKGRALYVGRAHHENGTHPGKVFAAGGTNICNIGYGGKEITYNTFEVLVENPPHRAKDMLRHDNRCGMLGKKAYTATLGKYIGSMGKERQIDEGQSLVSSNIRYQVRVTNDGRMVLEEILDRALCDDGRILVFETNEIWSNTSKGGDPSLDYFLKFQEDSNLCIYSKQNGFVWCSMSNGQNGHHLELTNIGHIEVVNDHGGEVWPD